MITWNISKNHRTKYFMKYYKNHGINIIISHSKPLIQNLFFKHLLTKTSFLQILSSEWSLHAGLTAEIKKQSYHTLDCFNPFTPIEKWTDPKSMEIRPNHCKIRDAVKGLINNIYNNKLLRTKYKADETIFSS